MSMLLTVAAVWIVASVVLATIVCVLIARGKRKT